MSCTSATKSPCINNAWEEAASVVLVTFGHKNKRAEDPFTPYMENNSR